MDNTFIKTMTGKNAFVVKGIEWNNMISRTKLLQQAIATLQLSIGEF
jgi:hypothetical protein